MPTLTALVPALYLLFTSRADSLAVSTGFIRRVRAFTGSRFAQTLVFGWLRRSSAPLEHLAHGLGIARQSLHERFTAPAAAFCQALLLEALQTLVQARPALQAPLRFFQGVFVDDCTQLWLPDDATDAFPGCGSARSDNSRARLKVLLRWELQRGGLHHLGIHSGRTGDTTTLTQAPPLPRGSLHLADLGFTDFARLQAETDAGVYWLMRLPAHTRLFVEDPHGRQRCPRHPGATATGEPLAQHLRRWRQLGQTVGDLAARVGDKDAVAGRLIALACPPEVVARRLARLEKEAQRRGRPVSARQRELCHWTVLFTNVPAEWLDADQLWEVYRLRWQIELLIKRFKSEGGLGTTRSTKKEVVLCEWYLKLLGQVVRNWLQLLSGGPLRNVNGAQLGRVIADGLEKVWQGLREGIVALWEALWQLREELERVRPRTQRHQQAPAAQRLEAMEKARASGKEVERVAS